MPSSSELRAVLLPILGLVLCALHVVHAQSGCHNTTYEYDGGQPSRVNFSTNGNGTADVSSYCFYNVSVSASYMLFIKLSIDLKDDPRNILYITTVNGTVSPIIYSGNNGTNLNIGVVNDKVMLTFAAAAAANADSYAIVEGTFEWRPLERNDTPSVDATLNSSKPEALIRVASLQLGSWLRVSTSVSGSTLSLFCHRSQFDVLTDYYLLDGPLQDGRFVGSLQDVCVSRRTVNWGLLPVILQSGTLTLLGGSQAAFNSLLLVASTTSLPANYTVVGIPAGEPSASVSCCDRSVNLTATTNQTNSTGRVSAAAISVLSEVSLLRRAFAQGVVFQNLSYSSNESVSVLAGGPSSTFNLFSFNSSDQAVWFPGRLPLPLVTFKLALNQSLNFTVSTDDSSDRGILGGLQKSRQCGVLVTPSYGWEPFDDYVTEDAVRFSSPRSVSYVIRSDSLDIDGNTSTLLINQTHTDYSYSVVRYNATTRPKGSVTTAEPVEELVAQFQTPGGIQHGFLIFYELDNSTQYIPSTTPPPSRNPTTTPGTSSAGLRFASAVVSMLVALFLFLHL